MEGVCTSWVGLGPSSGGQGRIHWAPAAFAYLLLGSFQDRLFQHTTFLGVTMVHGDRAGMWLWVTVRAEEEGIPHQPTS